MAPEQFMEHRATIDARTDVYAIGVVMHELLCGRLPYDVMGKSLVETARIVQETTPTRPALPPGPSPSALRTCRVAARRRSSGWISSAKRMFLDWLPKTFDSRGMAERSTSRA